MKKIQNLSFAAIIIAGLFFNNVSAAPGDTTWVTIYNLRKITQYGNIDTMIKLPPAKSYRKIRLHYTIGRYACPGSPQYCGSWDYTTQIFARPKNHDSVEIARVITPYATDWLQQNRKHNYIVDVTDYTTALRDSTEMRFRYEGYSWGFTITLKLEYIEGTPPMNPVAVKNIYSGYFPYGNANNPIENYLSPKTHSYSASAYRCFIKNTVSGHGADATGCSEFCNKYYQLRIDNIQVDQKQLWRSDCGINQVYPQTGTWVFNRGNWCPGAVVNPIYHDISYNTTPGSTFSVDINMQPYAVANPSGGYNYETQLISYGAENFNRDISLEDIIAPTIDENYGRQNSACMNPIVKIKGTGTDSVYSVVFEYGIRGLVPNTYTWTGSIGFLQEKEITFPPSTNLMGQTVSLPFDVRIVSVNDMGQDENLQNNFYTSKTTPVTIFPSDIVINTVTNGSAAGPTGKSQTSWKLEDENGSIVASATSMNVNSTNQTSLSLPDGCYKLKVEDSGCDGFSWWYYQYYNQNPGNGTMNITLLPANGNINFSGDFGCGFTKYFYVGTAPALPPAIDYTAINENANPGNHISVYPVPSGENAFIRLAMQRPQSVEITINDMSGRLILKKTCASTALLLEEVPASKMDNGVYLVNIRFDDNTTVSRKLLVQH